VRSADLNPLRERGHSSKQEGIMSIEQSSFSTCPKHGVIGVQKRQIHGVFSESRGMLFPADFNTTGRGVKKDDSCGVFFMRGCLETHLHESMDPPKRVAAQIGFDGKTSPFGVYYERWVHSCFRQACPKCWKKWAIRETKRAARRLRAFKLKGRNLKPIHIMVQIPYVDWMLNLQQMRVKVYIILKKLHILGGMSIYHPDRWRNGFAYFAPHFHIIGYGWLGDTRKNYYASGYVVKNLRIRKNVEGTIWYQLSHAGFHPKHHTVTWFGCLHPSKLKIPKEDPDEHRCPFCMGKLKQILWIGDGSCPISGVEGNVGYGDAQGWVYADVLGRAGGTKSWR